MSELLKKQKFGVEVEFTGITRTMAAEAVAEILGSHATGPDRTCYRTYTIRDSKRRIWKVMRDSSICPVRKAGRELMDEYRVEFVTPPLNYEDIETLQSIIRKFKELGGVPHSSCGIHIHVDGADQASYMTILSTVDRFRERYPNCEWEDEDIDYIDAIEGFATNLLIATLGKGEANE